MAVWPSLKQIVLCYIFVEVWASNVKNAFVIMSLNVTMYDIYYNQLEAYQQVFQCLWHGTLHADALRTAHIHILKDWGWKYWFVLQCSDMSPSAVFRINSFQHKHSNLLYPEETIWWNVLWDLANIPLVYQRHRTSKHIWKIALTLTDEHICCSLQMSVGTPFR